MASTHGAFAQETAVDYQKIADGAKFDWSKEKASAFYSMCRYKGEGEVQLIRNAGEIPFHGYSLTIRFVRDDKVLLSIAGHDATVFHGVDDVVYYASYSQSGPGCTVIAYDLAQQKQLWQTELKALKDSMGIEYYRISGYFSSMNLSAGKNTVAIYGHETNGDYLEMLDTKTGKVIGQKVLKTPKS
jgi:hypothetical protein